MPEVKIVKKTPKSIPKEEPIEKKIETKYLDKNIQNLQSADFKVKPTVKESRK